MKRRRFQGITLVEIMVAIVLVSALFVSGFKVLSHARRETVKGLWLQQAIVELRNGTREIAQHLKRTSYPSTLYKRGNMEAVVSFKDYRIYDDSGRLRDIKTRDTDSFDIHATAGHTIPDDGETTILRFPICSAETDFGTSSPGKITWVELILRPAPVQTGIGSTLGTLVLCHREDVYQTQGLLFRAFSLTKTFDPGLPLTREKAIISDVQFVDVSMFSVDELRGIAVSTAGAVVRKTRRRFLVSIQIGCCHPKDPQTRISDQCSVISNIDVLSSGGPTLVVLSVSGPTARISYLGQPSNVGVNSVIGGVFRVKTVLPNGIVVTTIPGNTVRTYLIN